VACFSAGLLKPGLTLAEGRPAGVEVAPTKPGFGFSGGPVRVVRCGRSPGVAISTGVAVPGPGRPSADNARGWLQPCGQAFASGRSAFGCPWLVPALGRSPFIKRVIRIQLPGRGRARVITLTV